MVKNTLEKDIKLAKDDHIKLEELINTLEIKLNKINKANEDLEKEIKIFKKELKDSKDVNTILNRRSENTKSELEKSIEALESQIQKQNEK